MGIQESSAEGVDAEGVAFAFDIKLYDEDGNSLGDSWKENGTVTVSFSGSRVDEIKENAEHVEILHIADDGQEAVVENVEMNSRNRRRDGLEFKAEHFSVYAVKAIEAQAMVEGEGFTFDAQTGTLTITGDPLMLSIPTEYKNDTEKLVINTSSDIGSYSFMNYFPKEVSLYIEKAGTIMSDAFSQCKIGGVIKIDECGNLENYAFGRSARNVTSLEIGVCAEIETGALNPFSSSLERVQIGKCTSLGTAFSNMKALKEVEIDECGDIKDGTFSYSDKLENLKIGTCGNIGSQYMPGLKKLEIGECAKIGNFYNFQPANTALIEEITIGKCTIIDTSAFQNASNLKKLHIGECEKIKTWAFNGAYLLTDLQLDKIGYIGLMAFNGAGKNGEGIQNLTLENVELDDNAFGHVKINTLVLKNNGDVGSQAFVSATIENIVLSGVKTLGSEAFAYLKGLKQRCTRVN